MKKSVLIVIGICMILIFAYSLDAYYIDYSKYKCEKIPNRLGDSPFSRPSCGANEYAAYKCKQVKGTVTCTGVGIAKGKTIKKPYIVYVCKWQCVEKCEDLQYRLRYLLKTSRSLIIAFAADAGIERG